MNQSYSAVYGAPADIFSPQIRLTPAQRQHAQSQAAQVGQRKYDVAYIDKYDALREFSTVARAHAAFEDAFAVLGHGALIQTDKGLMAVEDIMPGTQVRVGDGYFETLQWRGRITLTPPTGQTNAKSYQMTRVTGDALGFERPTQDLVLGPSARLLHRAAGIKRVAGTAAAFIPASDFIDGHSVLELQPSAPISVYQLGFAGQRSLVVNGLEIESLHPGCAFNLGLRGETLREYLSLFPHKHGFEDFGIITHPRLRLRDLDLLTA